MSQTFLEFVDRKVREGKKHLGLVKKLLERQGLSVTARTDEETPFIFVKSPNGSLSFEGIRVYKVGDVMAYRVQKNENTEPYGKAYMLDLEDMFEDYMADNIREEEAAQRIVQTVSEEIQKFFTKSAEAEQELRNIEFDRDGQDGTGKIVLRSTGTDYSNLVHSKM